MKLWNKKKAPLHEADTDLTPEQEEQYQRELEITRLETVLTQSLICPVHFLDAKATTTVNGAAYRVSCAECVKSHKESLQRDIERLKELRAVSAQ